jgi:hypothetical protein
MALSSAAGCDDDSRRRVLFIRGGSGTGGFLEGGADEHLSDVTDQSTLGYNHGFGQLAALLETELGLAVDQRVEGPASATTPVDLASFDLGRYAVIVFGSNNASYRTTDVDRLIAFVEDGGGALFASDGNWGSFWDKAPSSDQPFLGAFGLIMNQDGGGLVRLDGEDFLVPDHPILAGVQSFDGEGVSPCTLSRDPAALATPLPLVRTEGVVRRNTAPEGPVEPSTPDDAALTVVELGRGRVACHFDRNTFFNENGAGTSIAVVGNRTYARNLFAWLAGMP